jgi:hypothetical protein
LAPGHLTVYRCKREHGFNNPLMPPPRPPSIISKIY